MAVANLLSGMGVRPLSVELGVVTVAGSLPPGLRAELSEALGRLGFELLGDPREQTVDRIRTAIIHLVHYRGGLPDVNLSAYLSARLGSDYSALSKLFSEVTGVTIERYFILQRVERVKELLFYGEKSLAEIALFSLISQPESCRAPIAFAKSRGAMALATVIDNKTKGLKWKKRQLPFSA